MTQRKDKTLRTIIIIVFFIILLSSLGIFIAGMSYPCGSERQWTIAILSAKEKAAYRFLKANGVDVVLLSSSRPYRWMVRMRINNTADVLEIKKALEALNTITLTVRYLDDGNIVVIKDLKNLCWTLDISNTDVSDASIECLVSIVASNPWLHTIDANNTKITAESLKSLLLIEDFLPTGENKNRRLTFIIEHCKIPESLIKEIGKKHPRLIIYGMPAYRIKEESLVMENGFP